MSSCKQRKKNWNIQDQSSVYQIDEFKYLGVIVDKQGFGIQ